MAAHTESDFFLTWFLSSRGRYGAAKAYCHLLASKAHADEVRNYRFEAALLHRRGHYPKRFERDVSLQDWYTKFQLIQVWIEKSHPIATRAVSAFAPVFEGQLEDANMPPLEGVSEKFSKYYRDHLSSLGLEPPGPNASS